MFAVFNLCIFISAFLLFLIQPLIANILLPKVGGSPNIWNTCSVFFQISLLIGYLYSYIVSKKLSLKKQILVHCCLLFCALWVVNFHFQTDNIDMSSPISDTLWLLFKNIFFPFMILSTTSPLIQHWLASSNLKENKNPYILYVCSNVGSLLALYAYPLFFEKQLAISLQGTVWHIIFVAFFLCVISIGLYLRKSQDIILPETKEKSKINPICIFYWIFFAFVPSSLMLGVTSHLSTDIGGLPFLWILPLSLYLLSFIWTFSKFYTEEIAAQLKRLYKISAIVAIFLFYNLSLSSGLSDNIMFISIHCFLYFIFATYCHGVLSQKKPAPENLTLFYLCLSIGGALGGTFNTFIAPHLFTSIGEYPFIIALSLPFVLSGLAETKNELLKIGRNIIILSVIIVAFAYININLEEKTAHILFYIGVAVLLPFIFTQKKSFIFLCVLSCIFSQLFIKENSDFLFKKRNFFGTLAVKKEAIISPHLSTLLLFHGDTLHGRQDIFENEGETTYIYSPYTYYGKGAAVEDFFKIYKKEKPSIAWLGLGSGAIICYAQPEAKHHIIEIDQDIIDISKKYRYFRYMEKCAPEAKITVGDARVEIQKEENNKYDLIVVDVFSSHFIPVHLTTKEAIEIYRSKLKDDGVILFHISSRAFDIEPILTKIADSLGMTFIVRYRDDFYHSYPQWGVLSNSKNAPEIVELLSLKGWREGKSNKDTALWTDDFHNLLSALRR